MTIIANNLRLKGCPNKQSKLLILDARRHLLCSRFATILWSSSIPRSRERCLHRFPSIRQRRPNLDIGQKEPVVTEHFLDWGICCQPLPPPPLVSCMVFLHTTLLTIGFSLLLTNWGWCRSVFHHIQEWNLKRCYLSTSNGGNGPARASASPPREVSTAVHTEDNGADFGDSTLITVPHFGSHTPIKPFSSRIPTAAAHTKQSPWGCFLDRSHKEWHCGLKSTSHFRPILRPIRPCIQNPKFPPSILSLRGRLHHPLLIFSFLTTLSQGTANQCTTGRCTRRLKRWTLVLNETSLWRSFILRFGESPWMDFQ